MLTMIQDRWNEHHWRINAMCRDLDPDLFLDRSLVVPTVEALGSP